MLRFKLMLLIMCCSSAGLFAQGMTKTVALDTLITVQLIEHTTINQEKEMGENLKLSESEKLVRQQDLNYPDQSPKVTLYEGNLEEFEVESEASESPELPFDVSGSIDTYFRQTINSGRTAAPATSFANLPGFSLGMANVVIAKEVNDVGFTADLVVGPRGADAVFVSAAPLNIVNQLYAYWNASDKVTLTIGNFNTFLGYEVISPTGNFNYSTSYMFSYGPFSHSGLKADFDLGKGFSLMVGVLNPTDETDFNISNGYLGGVQLGYDFGAGSFYLNTLFDDEFFQIDLTGGVDVTEDFYLGINSSLAVDNFFGAAAYLQYTVSDAFALGTRVEYFADQGIGVVGLDENAIDATLSANISIGDLTIIPELRVDVASADVFTNTDDEPSSNLASFVLAAVYGF